MSPKQLVFVICTWSLATLVAGKVHMLVSFDALSARWLRHLQDMTRETHCCDSDGKQSKPEDAVCDVHHKMLQDGDTKCKCNARYVCHFRQPF
jgi:hypothetical protein